MYLNLSFAHINPSYYQSIYLPTFHLCFTSFMLRTILSLFSLFSPFVFNYTSQTPYHPANIHYDHFFFLFTFHFLLLTSPSSLSLPLVLHLSLYLLSLTPFHSFYPLPLFQYYVVFVVFLTHSYFSYPQSPLLSRFLGLHLINRYNHVCSHSAQSNRAHQ